MEDLLQSCPQQKTRAMKGRTEGKQKDQALAPIISMAMGCLPCCRKKKWSLGSYPEASKGAPFRKGVGCVCVYKSTGSGEVQGQEEADWLRDVG